MATAVEKDYWKVSEVSDLLDVSEATVVSWIESKELVASDVSTKGAKKRLFRVPKSELESFIQRRTTAKKTAKKKAKPFQRAKTDALKSALKKPTKGVAKRALKQHSKK